MRAAGGLVALSVEMAGRGLVIKVLPGAAASRSNHTPEWALHEDTLSRDQVASRLLKSPVKLSVASGRHKRAVVIGLRSSSVNQVSMTAG